MSATDAGHGDDFAAESLDKWTPRFVANGVDPNDLDRLRTDIESWADWCDAFTALGDEHAALGEAAEDRGDREGIAVHFTQAAMYYHFGSHVWHEDDDQRDAAHRRAVDAFSRGGTHLDPPVQRIEAPLPDGDAPIPGHLRVPDHGPNGATGGSPLVVLLPGLDSIKEELHPYGRSLLDRGVAILAVDGPAQGESWYHYPMTPDYPAAIAAVVDCVQDLDPEGVDPTRLGVYGVSLGGYYAPSVAANDPRFDACVGVSGPFTVGPVSSRPSALLREQFAWACHAESMVEVDEITEAMTLRDDIERLEAPALMVTGANDHIIDPAQTERIATRAPNGEFVLYDDGNHVCNNIPYKYRPYVADWLRRHLG